MQNFTGEKSRVEPKSIGETQKIVVACIQVETVLRLLKSRFTNYKGICHLRRLWKPMMGHVKLVMS